MILKFTKFLRLLVTFCLVVNCYFGSYYFSQDLYQFADNTKYPIWLSKTDVLLQLKDASKTSAVRDAISVERNINFKILNGFDKLVLLSFADPITKQEMETSLSELRKVENVITAHPLMVTPEGEAVGAFLEDLIVKIKPSTDFEKMQTFITENNFIITKLDTYDKNVFYITGPAVVEAPIAVCNQLYLSGLVEFAQPNCFRYVKLAGIPGDPLFSNQYGHTKMKLPDAWDITTGCSNIKIAIIDNGVQLTHPDLVGNLLPGYDAMGGSTSGGIVAGEQSHGTNCAGIAAATSNSIGIAGVAYNSKILPIRAFSTDAVGNLTGSKDAFIAAAINHAAANADIISLSWTITTTTTPAIDAAINNAINSAVTSGRGGKGCVIVGAVGNTNSTISPGLPTRNGNVLSIGASNTGDTRWVANTSNGSNYPTGSSFPVDVVAPGPYVTTLMEAYTQTA